MSDLQYPVKIRPLSQDEGGGYLVEYPDLPGCMADGETVEEALEEGQDAVKAWLATAKAQGLKVPPPNSKQEYSGQLRMRMPRSLHAELAARASDESVSLNSFIIALLAEGVGRASCQTKTRR